MSDSSSSSSNESSDEEIQFQERISLGHLEVEFSGVGRGIEERQSLLNARNIEKDFNTANFIGRCTNWLALIMTIVIAVLLSMVTASVPTLYFVIWTILWWVCVLLELVGFIGSIFTSFTIQKGKALTPTLAFVFISFLLFVVVFCLGSCTGFEKLGRVAYAYVQAYDSDPENAELVLCYLIYASYLCIPIVIFLCVTIRGIYAGTTAQNTLIRYLMYWALILFILFAAGSLVLSKYTLEWDESPAVGGAFDTSLIFGIMGLSLVSIGLSLFYLFIVFKQWTRLFMLASAMLFVLTLLNLTFAGLEVRAIDSSRKNSNFALNIAETCWEDLDLVKYLSENSDGTCLEMINYEKSSDVKGNPSYSCFNQIGGDYIRQLVYLSFDIQVVFTTFLTCFGFILLALALLLVSDSDRLRSSKKTSLFDKLLILLLILFLIFLVICTIWFPVSVCNDSIGTGNSSVEAFEPSEFQGYPVTEEGNFFLASTLNPFNPESNRPSYTLLDLYDWDGGVNTVYPLTSDEDLGYRIALLGSFMDLSLTDSDVKKCSQETREYFFSDVPTSLNDYICFYGSSTPVFTALWTRLQLELNLVDSSFILQANVQEVSLSEINSDGLTSDEHGDRLLEAAEDDKTSEKKGRVLEGMGIEVSESEGITGSGDYYFSVDDKVPISYFQIVSGAIYSLSNGEYSKVSEPAVTLQNTLSKVDQSWTPDFFSDTMFELTPPLMIDYGYPASISVTSEGHQNLTKNITVGSPYVMNTTGPSLRLGSLVTVPYFSDESCEEATIAIEINSAAPEMSFEKDIQVRITKNEAETQTIQSFGDQVTFEVPCYGVYDLTFDTKGYWLPSSVSLPVAQANFSLCLSTSPSSDDFFSLISMDWASSNIDYDFEIVLFDPETQTAQYLTPEQPEAEGISYTHDKMLGLNCPETVLIKYLVNSYYFIRVRPAPAYSRDGVSWDPNTYQGGVNQLSIRMFVKGYDNELYTFNEPADISGDLEWSLGCFHGGGWEYLKVMDFVGGRDIVTPGDCLSLFTSEDDLEAWKEKTASLSQVEQEENDSSSDEQNERESSSDEEEESSKLESSSSSSEEKDPGSEGSSSGSSSSESQNSSGSNATDS